LSYLFASFSFHLTPIAFSGTLILAILKYMFFRKEVLNS
jgi:hypothetical protein